MVVTLIVAHDQRRGIGRARRMPWHIPGESKWTSEVTRRAPHQGLRNALIMGRTTYLSIPERRRPLFDRVNIVVSSRRGELGEGAVCAASFSDGLRQAATADGIGDVFIFGGAQIYRQALTQLAADELLISVVQGDYRCDTFFPELPDAYVLNSSKTILYDSVEVRHDHYLLSAGRSTNR